MITFKIITNDIFKITNTPKKSLRDIIGNANVNVFLFIGKNHSSDITTSIIDYCDKHGYNICGIAIKDDKNFNSDLMINLITESPNINCVLTPTMSDLTRSFGKMKCYLNKLKNKGIYFETLDYGVID